MKKFRFSSLVLLLVFLLGMAVVFTEETFYQIEKSVFSALRLISPAMDKPFTFITELGSAVGVISVTAVILIVTLFKRKYFFTVGLPVTITVIVSRVVNITLKILIDRPRPDFRVLEVSEASFPSGHAQNNMALYISVLLVLLFIVNAPKWRIPLKIILIAVPVIIGITRVYFGVHYISDVVSGWAMGAFTSILVNYFYFKIYYSIKEKKNAKN